MPEQEISFRIDEPLVLMGTIALVLWLSSERLLQLFGLCQPKALRRETLSFYWLGFISFYGAVFFSFLDATVFRWTTVGSSLSSLRYAGIPFVLVGFAIRVVSRLKLGKHFSGHVQTIEGHRLITTGIYSSIRHPLYLGYLCLLLGFSVCFGSIGGFVCAIVLGIPALIYRIRIEEAALEKWFPEEYQRYRTTTRKLIPRLW
ncbi:MAG: isoprenylcysteine carboxylmethyltransferase family protein [bacterium]|nr:isoprenylcysteine carboxylmethyltransferase family protein [bacterium]